jgi:hypothetical protein
MLDAVGVVTDNTDPEQVNPGFPGYWSGNLPPH